MAYEKPKKVLKPLKDKPPKLPSRHSMMLVEGKPKALAKGGCDFRPGGMKPKLLKG